MNIFTLIRVKNIGNYVAAMGSIDTIIFTIVWVKTLRFMRDKICNGLEYLGTRIDPGT